MKRFLFVGMFEDGTDSMICSDFDGLDGVIVGWGAAKNHDEDNSLRDWCKTADIGDFKHHSAGVAVRLKDS